MSGLEDRIDDLAASAVMLQLAGEAYLDRDPELARALARLGSNLADHADALSRAVELRPTGAALVVVDGPDDAA